MQEECGTETGTGLKHHAEGIQPGGIIPASENSIKSKQSLE